MLELEAQVRWLGGDYLGSLACAREAVELNPGGLSRRRAPRALLRGALRVETDQLEEARRNVATVARIYGDRTWFVASGFSSITPPAPSPGARAGSPTRSPRSAEGATG